MSDKDTISNKWRDWAKVEPIWAYSALILMAVAFSGLIAHLWVLDGIIRSIGLYVMIAGGVGCEVILILRKQKAWAWYWGLCVLFGVSVFEILSCFTNIFQ
ncbi:MAG: hypothetical protein KKD01_20190 [Proteobacteria bacterium]|nr:hypothetical protein [Pseudomonadota bacterium]